MMRLKTPIFALFVAAGCAAIGFGALIRRAEAVQRKPPPVDAGAAVAQLEARVKQLEGLVPNQPTVMTHVAYHFTNLWFAGERQNWPLAEYYLGAELQKAIQGKQHNAFVQVIKFDPAGK